MLSPFYFAILFVSWVYFNIFHHLKRLTLWNQAPFGVLTTISRIHSGCVNKDNIDFLPSEHVDWLLQQGFAQFEVSRSISHLESDLDKKLSLTPKWYRFFDKLTVDFEFHSSLKNNL